MKSATPLKKMIIEMKMKIKFMSDDDLPLNKPLKFHAMTIIVRSVFEDDSKRYSQVFLDDALYEC